MHFISLIVTTGHKIKLGNNYKSAFFMAFFVNHRIRGLASSWQLNESIHRVNNCVYLSTNMPYSILNLKRRSIGTWFFGIIRDLPSMRTRCLLAVPARLLSLKHGRQTTQWQEAQGYSTWNVPDTFAGVSLLLRLSVGPLRANFDKCYLVQYITRATFETPKYPWRPRDQYTAQIVNTLELSAPPPNRG